MSVELILVVLIIAIAAGLWIIFSSPGIRPRQKIFVIRCEMDNGLHCDAFLFRKEMDAEAEVRLLKESKFQEMNRLGIRDVRIVVLFVR